MKSAIANLLQEFGKKIGLSSPLDLGEEGSIRLNLSDTLAIDFEEENNGKTVWIYMELFPGEDVAQEKNLWKLLRLMLHHHRLSDARLTMDPDGFQLFLVSSFSLLPTEEEELSPTAVDRFDEHLKRVVELAETLRTAIHEGEKEKQLS